jgi:hypothetical protein
MRELPIPELEAEAQRLFRTSSWYACASSKLVMRSRLQVRREIARRAQRRSLLWRALTPVVLYLTILYGTVIYSAFHSDFDQTILKVVCVSCDVLAILLPCLVVWKSKHDDTPN